MLKRLELVGFKSFADKTAFDFPPGVTAIVGPNGSGKSNVVDAVRWVLGEQSAKSLRGGEMADVIFNGSASRKSLGLAEVTMTFDNGRRALNTEAEEVQITRRVYRSGEGEYLINGQPCRLKDIKNLFLGSGAGADAYCIIEQGRVDVLLQASTKDRRTIFEEAAGISRFKAKKTETLRRLERVDQNVQRLRDILDEVEKQLRSVKLQAAKAQRYQEYSTRLRELRVGLGLQEYHQLTERLAAEQAVLDALRSGLAEQTSQTESWEAELRELEGSLRRLDEAVSAEQGRLSQGRQQIATGEATLNHEWALSADLEADLSRARGRLTELSGRVAALAAAAAAVAEQRDAVEVQCQRQREGTKTLEEELAAAAARLTELVRQTDRDKGDHVEMMRQAARLQNDVVSYKAQLDTLRRERERLRLKTEQAAEHLASVDLELQELTAADERLQARLAITRQTLAERRQERDRLVAVRDETQQSVADLKARRSGLASRVEVLEGLERSHEGLGAGAREVVSLLEQPDSEAEGSPTLGRVVLGMTADFLTVKREYAPLIDLALGDAALRFLVRDASALDETLRRREQPFAGRVSFLALPPRRSPPPAEPEAAWSAAVTHSWLDGREDRPGEHGVALGPGVVAPAARLVTCERPELSDLPERLLGRTLLVRDLASARALAARAEGWRFVTLRGELLEADGTLTVGTHHAETGILSRKSELRELLEQAAALDRRIAECELDLAGLRERVAVLDRELETLQEEIDVLAEQAADLRSRVGQHRQRLEGLYEEVALSRTEISGVEQEIATAEAAWREAVAHVERAEQEVQATQRRITEAEAEARAEETRRERRQQELTAAKVALAQVEERLSALRARQRQAEADLEQRRQERTQVEQHLTAARARLDESQRALLQASSLLAEAYLLKESAEARLSSLEAERESVRQRRRQVGEQIQSVRSSWREQQEQAHGRELEVNDLTHRRTALVERLREDYQLELAEEYRRWREAQTIEAQAAGGAPEQSTQYSVLSTEVSPTATPDPQEEIAELRRKLNRLGSVNLESLQELADLEARAAALQAQYDDLSAAKKALEVIFGHINADSTRLFTETFHTIRTHFQELFRKLFGGGMADVVLEDEGDVLESGIEVIARPPGKELRSISLMSGGEKTMTAVALLLAIFRSKPSPFCLLDEVDAALDEANVGRFTAVLRDFLDRSQFIIVTHSKRTMQVADVLYGVTMQESGISKRVAVRFEDWPDDGSAPPPEAPALGSFGGK